MSSRIIRLVALPPLTLSLLRDAVITTVTWAIVRYFTRDISKIFIEFDDIKSLEYLAVEVAKPNINDIDIMQKLQDEYGISPIGQRQVSSRDLLNCLRDQVKIQFLEDRVKFTTGKVLYQLPKDTRRVSYYGRISKTFIGSSRYHLIRDQRLLSILAIHGRPSGQQRGFSQLDLSIGDVYLKLAGRLSIPRGARPIMVGIQLPILNIHATKLLIESLMTIRERKLNVNIPQGIINLIRMGHVDLGLQAIIFRILNELGGKSIDLLVQAPQIRLYISYGGLTEEEKGRRAIKSFDLGFYHEVYRALESISEELGGTPLDIAGALYNYLDQLGRNLGEDVNALITYTRLLIDSILRGSIDYDALYSLMRLTYHKANVEPWRTLWRREGFIRMLT